MKNIFVSGGSGFLGRSLIRSLSNHNIIAPNSNECNLQNINNLKKFSKKKFDEIYHLAAWTQAGDFCLKHPGEQWINNQIINTNMLKWWKEYQSKAKFTFIGTSCSYDPNLELKEENYMRGKPIDSLYTYAMTKRMLLVGANSLYKQFNLKWNCYVPSTLYGPFYHKDGRQMHFIFDLILKILKGKYFDEPVILWGNGNQKREIIFVDDFVKNMILINRKVENKILNIGAGKEYTIKQFAKKISKIIGYDFSKIKFDRSKYTGAKSKKLDIRKVKKIVPSYQSNLTNLELGLKKTIRWVKNELLNNS